MTTAAKDQVQRLLALVPYLRARDGIAIEQVAADFGVSPGQIGNDLHVLWFCGLPGAVSGDLIDVDMDALDGEGVVRLGNADYLGRPLRLDVHEALALIVALRTLHEVCGPGERDAIDRALLKLESAAGDAMSRAEQVDVQIEAPDRAVSDAVNESLRTGKRLRIAYYVPARDETTEREVDPMRLVVAEGRSYLEAWCRRVEDVRMFRLDRIAQIEVLAAAAEPPPQARSRDLSAGLFQPSPTDLLATVELDPSARWVAEYYPCESVTELGSGRMRVTLRVSDPAWLRRLVLRLGGAARLVSPAEDAAAIRAAAAEALKAYDTA
ncbi:MAG TPA: WYL domain-containing protein [Nocardioidaceae bacterium]|nr:WYL domain-containing protein [Nocardioidaceae bacterium]